MSLTNSQSIWASFKKSVSQSDDIFASFMQKFNNGSIKFILIKTCYKNTKLKVI